MAIGNFEAMLKLADNIDKTEGMLAYLRYHHIMRALEAKYLFPLERVIAVFVSLSPNNDYLGNLRSTVSVLEGLKNGLSSDDITVSTYGHCKDRAIEYALGYRDFLSETKGPKIINFYHNILDPSDVRWVTIDGHMSAIWKGEDLTMKEALIGANEYREISAAIKALAFRHFMIPNQLQAVLWFTRKRVFRKKFDPQGDVFDYASHDVWKTLWNIEDIKPYGKAIEPIEQPASGIARLNEGRIRILAQELQLKLAIGFGSDDGSRSLPEDLRKAIRD